MHATLIDCSHKIVNAANARYLLYYLCILWDWFVPKKTSFTLGILTQKLRYHNIMKNQFQMMNKLGGGRDGGLGIEVPMNPCTGYLDACLREQLAGQVRVEGRGHGQHGQVLGARRAQTKPNPAQQSQT